MGDNFSAPAIIDHLTGRCNFIAPDCADDRHLLAGLGDAVYTAIPALTSAGLMIVTVAHQSSDDAPRRPFSMPRAVTHRLKIKGVHCPIRDRIMMAMGVPYMTVICVRIRPPNSKSLLRISSEADPTAYSCYLPVPLALTIFVGPVFVLVDRCRDKLVPGTTTLPLHVASFSLPGNTVHVALKDQRKSRTPFGPSLVHSLKFLCGGWLPGAKATASIET
ncbi:hypothetical protein H4582DRAFT_2057328 [Lactarius indigo]|nr:hypothetical protein H4582DRAFT_2057328 [Lactarius indigo]